MVTIVQGAVPIPYLVPWDIIWTLSRAVHSLLARFAHLVSYVESCAYRELHLSFKSIV